MSQEERLTSYLPDDHEIIPINSDTTGKRVDNYLRLDETRDYIETLFEEDLNTSDVRNYRVGRSHFVKTKRGKKGGTWFHPDLAVHFARWIDVRFIIWCDRQIRDLLKGTHPHFDWKRIRHEASSSYKVMDAVLQLVRQNEGKKTQHFHYANEAKLVNWAITGEFKKLNREQLKTEELDLLAKLEERNTVLIGCGLKREERKVALTQFVSDFNTPMLAEGGAV